MDEQHKMMSVPRNGVPPVADLRSLVRELVKALKGVTSLFEEPQPFYIKKLGSPINVGDQFNIDSAFEVADKVLARAEREIGEQHGNK